MMGGLQVYACHLLTIGFIELTIVSGYTVSTTLLRDMRAGQIVRLKRQTLPKAEKLVLPGNSTSKTRSPSAVSAFGFQEFSSDRLNNNGSGRDDDKGFLEIPSGRDLKRNGIVRKPNTNGEFQKPNKNLASATKIAKLGLDVQSPQYQSQRFEQQTVEVAAPTPSYKRKRRISKSSSKPLSMQVALLALGSVMAAVVLVGILRHYVKRRDVAKRIQDVYLDTGIPRKRRRRRRFSARKSHHTHGRSSIWSMSTIAEHEEEELGDRMLASVTDGLDSSDFPSNWNQPTTLSEAELNVIHAEDGERDIAAMVNTEQQSEDTRDAIEHQDLENNQAESSVQTAHQDSFSNSQTADRVIADDRSGDRTTVESQSGVRVLQTLPSTVCSSYSATTAAARSVETTSGRMNRPKFSLNLVSSLKHPRQLTSYKRTCFAAASSRGESCDSSGVAQGFTHSNSQMYGESVVAPQSDRRRRVSEIASLGQEAFIISESGRGAELESASVLCDLSPRISFNRVLSLSAPDNDSDSVRDATTIGREATAVRSNLHPFTAHDQSVLSHTREILAHPVEVSSIPRGVPGTDLQLPDVRSSPTSEPPMTDSPPDYISACLSNSHFSVFSSPRSFSDQRAGNTSSFSENSPSSLSTFSSDEAQSRRTRGDKKRTQRARLYDHLYRQARSPHSDSSTAQSILLHTPLERETTRSRSRLVRPPQANPALRSDLSPNYSPPVRETTPLTSSAFDRLRQARREQTAAVSVSPSAQENRPEDSLAGSSLQPPDNEELRQGAVLIQQLSNGAQLIYIPAPPLPNYCDDSPPPYHQ